MKHVVMFSSGIGSWAAAKRVAAQHGTQDLILLFADTLIEDEDNYRFLEEAAANVGGQLVKVADGRDPWQVFYKERFLSNFRLAHCSHRLKQDPCRSWLKEIDPDHESTLYLGIDWSEDHRISAISKSWQPWKVDFPMTAAPYLDKSQMLEWAESEGLMPPRLYSLPFAHSNCGGTCVRAGKGHWATVLKHFPERFADWEAKEQEFRNFLGKDVSILRNQVDGKVKPLTLKAFREQIESRPEQLDLFDWGSCGCFTLEASE